VTNRTSKGIGRRNFLKLVGNGAAVIAVGALGVTTWRAVDQGVFSTNTGPAYVAWQDWNLPAQDHLDLVRAAILAANAHDSQPWLFKLGANNIDLYANTVRNFGTIDPFRREMYISLGCALENLLLAAHARGLAPTLTLMRQTKHRITKVGWIIRSRLRRINQIRIFERNSSI
jgi:hypothetical protein